MNGQSAGNGRMWKKGDDRVREGAGGREIRDNKKEQRRTYIPRFEPNVSSHRAGKMHFELSKVLILSLFVRVPKLLKFADVLHCIAVAVVRLMRIEEGGAFVDVLSGEGDDSWKDEMAYVGRTLGFRVTELELRGRRLVRKFTIHCELLLTSLC